MPARRIPLALWTACSVLGLVTLFLAFAGKADPAHVMRYVGVGPVTALDTTALAALAVWLLAGGVALRLARGGLAARDVLPTACLFALGVLYTNVLRERMDFGPDIADFARAAANLAHGEHLHARYIYPPLWAEALQWLTPLGPRAVLLACWALNFVALLAFFTLLRRALRVYGLVNPLATLAAFGFAVVNVPLLRTLLYVQVNLEVMDLALLALLYRRSLRPLSALALALAVHLKASPALLVIAFLVERDGRWLLWFVTWVGALFAVTVAADGLGPYADFVHNVTHIVDANGLTFRDNSFDSFFRALAGPTGLAPGAQVALTLACKAALAAVGAWIGVRWLRRRPFAAGESAGTGAAATLYPLLLVLMTWLSPLVWEHHPVFLALPFLLLPQVLDTPAEWAWFAVAWFLEFWVPTFDFFPWSYGRLFAALVWVVLAWGVARAGRGPSARLAQANAWAARVAPAD